jgi:hypothetical protein
MRLNPALRYVLLTLLCVSVLVACVSGAHMHFCLDGSEPRASLHVMDGFDMRHDAGMDAPHHDVDILLGEQTLSKSGQLSVDLPLLLIATLCLLLLRPKRRESFVLLVATDHRAPSHLRPPSCGPPSLFSH